jgi:hypothetical protein
MTAKLGETYIASGHYPEAVALFRDLAPRNPRTSSVLVRCGYLNRGKEAAYLLRGSAGCPECGR